MSNRELDRELYIFGEPVVTDLGKVRFLTYKQYLLNIQNLSMMSMNVLHIYYQYRKMFDKIDEEAMKAVESIKDESLYNIVVQSDNFKDAYIKIFEMVFESDEMVASVIGNEDNFMLHREIVMEMNMLSEAEVNKNPEIQKGIEMSNKLKSDSSDSPTPTDIVSSIVAGTSTSFEAACNMTVLQLYSIFYRLGAFKNYETTTLFATVSGDVKIESWSKQIDMFEKGSSAIKKKDFEKQYGGLLK